MTDTNFPQEFWDHELTAIPEKPPDWLWHGFVAGGNTTLLTSMWKAGKTTLLSLLLSRRKHGGALAGLPVKPGKTVVISEEPQALWVGRARRHDYGGHVYFITRPFLHIPRPEEWQALIDRILALQAEHGIDLAVIDPLAPFLRNENLARDILETLLPLTALTRRGLAVLLLHHPGKGPRPLGEAARGSGALLGHIDISIEMRHPGGDPCTRRRRFLSLSRHADTPRQLFLELNPEGTDYVAVQGTPEASSINWEPLRMVLEEAPQKLTRRDILAEWPEDFDKPHRSTLWKWLEHAVATHMIAREGTGRKTDPFRYWLPEREAVWQQDPFYEYFEEQRRVLNLPFQSLQERKRRKSHVDDLSDHLGTADFGAADNDGDDVS
jgi:hypothetical protein